MASPPLDANSPDDNASDAERVASSPGPAEVPYSGMNQNTFTLCNLLPSRASAPGLYSRAFLGMGIGYPIWEPSAHLDVPESRRMRGVSIGDVGIVDNNGNFAFGFNIYHSSEDSINLGCTPPDFVPLDFPEPPQQVRDEGHFPPKTVLASKTVEVTHVNESPLYEVFVPPSFSSVAYAWLLSHISISTTAKEGAALVLPFGGFREDLISTEHLRKYLAEHAVDWYQHLIQMSSAQVHNASLYLVTGCDKTRSWHMANLRGASADLKETATKDGETRYDWFLGANSRCRSMSLEDGEGQLFTLFVRGIKVAVPNRIWRHKVEDTLPDNIPYYDILATSIDIYRAKALRWLDYIAKGRNTWQSKHEASVFVRIASLSISTSAERFSFTPSLFLHKFFMKSAMADGSLKEIIRLLSKILASHDIQTVDKCVMFVPKPEPDPTQAKEPGLVQRIVGRIKWESTPEEKAAKRIAAILRRQS
ncbi:hypothetical protein NLJ89_g4478 [Agrocybe chaxingu]|uniref:Uncharacterized protein n=1 Tax=Agrocybe chaxingu TaxID=84603 RepID=A0A9W8MXP3_9AGAR|nr:hypothetical protein NLJ89_g4478 [Agrocybe chaxingu]